MLRVSLVIAAVFALAGLLSPHAAQAQMVSQTAMAGPYSVTLKVLPAESFTGSKAEMVRDGGAAYNPLDSPIHPNHHMVAFIKKDGVAVEDANVTIRYRHLSPPSHEWTRLPVVRMHVAGKGLGSTHYGNNLKLDSGSYQVEVTVNNDGPATFHFSL